MSLRDQDRPATRSAKRGEGSSARDPSGLLFALDGIAQHATPVKLAVRQRIAFSSTADDVVYAVKSGVIVARARLAQGPIQYFGLRYPGDAIFTGEVPAFGERTLFAVTPAEVWRFRGKSLAQYMSANLDLMTRYERARNRQLARAALQAAALATLDGPQRFAGFLIEMAREVGVAAGTAVAIELPLSRVEIAHYLALNADTLSRLMSRFKSEGLVTQKSRHHISLRDWRAVAALCPIAPAILAIERDRPSPLT